MEHRQQPEFVTARCDGDGQELVGSPDLLVSVSTAKAFSTAPVGQSAANEVLTSVPEDEEPVLVQLRTRHHMGAWRARVLGPIYGADRTAGRRIEEHPLPSPDRV